MPTTATPQLQYHPNAYQFIFAALRYTQQTLGRTTDTDNTSDAHISGKELLEGIRRLALKDFGLMAETVFKGWGITSTEDFGRVVFELVERGEMRKTDRDHLSDFIDVYQFSKAFDGYKIDCSEAFKA